jgi:hypothetical protein
MRTHWGLWSSASFDRQRRGRGEPSLIRVPAAKSSGVLKERLRDEMDNGIVAALVLADPAGGLGFIEEVAQCIRHNRNSKVAREGWSHEFVQLFFTATEQFVGQLNRRGYREPQTETECQAFRHLAEARTTKGFAVSRRKYLSCRQSTPLPA